MTRSPTLLPVGKPTNYYEILEVNNRAGLEQIRASYRRLVLKHHPDKGGCVEKFHKLSEAYRVLSNTDSRSAYDIGVLNYYCKEEKKQIAPQGGTNKNRSKLLHNLFNDPDVMPRQHIRRTRNGSISFLQRQKTKQKENISVDREEATRDLRNLLDGNYKGRCLKQKESVSSTTLLFSKESTKNMETSESNAECTGIGTFAANLVNDQTFRTPLSEKLAWIVQNPKPSRMSVTRISVLSVGPHQSGKSSIIKRFCEERFIPNNSPTCVLDFGVKDIKIPNDTIIETMKELCISNKQDVPSVFEAKYQANLERYRFVRANFFDSAGSSNSDSEILRLLGSSVDAVILVLRDGVDKYIDAVTWLSKISKYAPSAYLTIIAHCMDDGKVKHFQTESLKSSIESVAKFYGASCFKCSAYSGLGVDRAIKYTAASAVCRLILSSKIATDLN